MAILFAAAEAEAFAVTGTAEMYGLTTEVDTDFVRNAITLASGATATCTFTAQTAGWAHMRVQFPTLSANFLGAPIQLIDSGTAQVVLQLDEDGVSGTQGQFNLEYWNGSALTEILASDFPLFANILYTFDFHWVIDDVSGLFEWYVDGVLVAQYTGDTLHTGFTQIDTLTLTQHGTGTGSANGVSFSEIIVATEDTRPLRVHGMYATAAGTNTAWTGDNTAVDEATFDDTDFIESGTADQKESYACTDLSAVADNFSVRAVALNARALRDTTGPQNMELLVRSGGTDYTSGNVSGLTTSFAPFSYIWATDPATAAAWTTSGVNAAEIGVVSRT